MLNGRKGMSRDGFKVHLSFQFRINLPNQRHIIPPNHLRTKLDHAHARNVLLIDSLMALLQKYVHVGIVGGHYAGDASAVTRQDDDGLVQNPR